MLMDVDSSTPAAIGRDRATNSALPQRPDRRRVACNRAAVAWSGADWRKRGSDLRERLNAIRYLARSGVGWRMLPINFGPWQTVYGWFRRFVRRLLFQTIHDVAVMIDRQAAGRKASPTAGVIDNLWSLSIACGNGTFGASARRSRHRLRGCEATTPTRRSSAANGTSRWTAMAVC